MLPKLLEIIGSVFRDNVWRPEFFIAIAVILLLERLFPVNPRQSMLSTGFLQDSVWFVIGILFEGIFVAVYVRAFTALYEKYFGFLTIHAVDGWSQPARIVFGILLADFFAWAQHRLKHAVPWFWHFHAVHHSQKEINLFTDFRFHFFEYLVSRPIVFIPMMMFGVETPHIVVYSVLSTWQTRFYHANIKTNLGWLRYVFVTPQSHRVHHSIDRRHADMNFGLMLSVWDRLFRTQVTDYDVYPETGVHDEEFPYEKGRGPLDFVVFPVRQLIYPLKKMARSFRRG